MRHEGIQQLDRVVLSHDDKDHVGGFNAIAAEMAIKRVTTMPGSQLGLGYKAEHCQAGQQWNWDGVKFEILYPLSYSLASENNRSCVIRVSHGQHAVLLTGDIESAAERQLLLKYRQTLKSTVMSSPHHGSATSSTAVFVNNVDAEHVVHSVGYRNRFGFPRPGVIRRYEQQGTQQWRNDQHGMVRFIFYPQREKPEIQAYRQTQKRFWRGMSGRDK